MIQQKLAAAALGEILRSGAFHGHSLLDPVCVPSTHFNHAGAVSGPAKSLEQSVQHMAAPASETLLEALTCFRSPSRLPTNPAAMSIQFDSLRVQFHSRLRAWVYCFQCQSMRGPHSRVAAGEQRHFGVHTHSPGGSKQQNPQLWTLILL